MLSWVKWNGQSSNRTCTFAIFSGILLSIQNLGRLPPKSSLVTNLHSIMVPSSISSIRSIRTCRPLTPVSSNTDSISEDERSTGTDTMILRGSLGIPTPEKQQGHTQYVYLQNHPVEPLERLWRRVEKKAVDKYNILTIWTPLRKGTWFPSPSWFLV